MEFEFKEATRDAAKLRMALVGPPGSGKAQPIDALVLTPTGWTAIGSLSVGDRVVDPDGGVARVTGVFPQGRKAVFRVVFSDNSETRCCNEHLWLTRTRSGRSEKVRSLADIRETLQYENRHNHDIPMVGRIDLGDGRELPLAPYLLGVLIGDGGMTSKAVVLTNPERELIETASALLPAGVEAHDRDGGLNWGLCRIDAARPNPLAAILRELGLMGCKSTEKQIPHQYLLASFNDRLELLRGLLDTDGYAKGHTVEYTTSSSELAYGVLDLVRSLGGKSSINSRIPHYTYKGEKREGQRNYRMQISMPGDINPFRLSRKAAAYTPRTKYQPTRYIDRVDPDGEAECVCISVDSTRNLYVTDDYIVTHNTYSALKVATSLAPGGRICLIDTEHDTALKYAPLKGMKADPPNGTFSFKHVSLKSYSPQTYIDVISAASKQGFDVLIIDSISHAWAGKDGALEQVNNATNDSRSKNSYFAWKDVTPLQNRFVESMIGCVSHLIVTLRTKVEYALETSDGKTVPKKIGTTPIQRDGIEYEFDVVLDMQSNQTGIVSKTRCSSIRGRSFPLPGDNLAQPLRVWLEGVADPAVVAAEVSRLRRGSDLIGWADTINSLRGNERSMALDPFISGWRYVIENGSKDLTVLDQMHNVIEGMPKPLSFEVMKGCEEIFAKRKGELSAANP